MSWAPEIYDLNRYISCFPTHHPPPPPTHTHTHTHTQTPTPTRQIWRWKSPFHKLRDEWVNLFSLIFFTGIPLVFESFSWEHGVMVGACVKSEATAAAEHSGKKIMHDPMAMRPFMGYNFGKYLEHWLSLNTPQHKVCIYFLDFIPGYIIMIYVLVSVHLCVCPLALHFQLMPGVWTMNFV